MGWQVCFETTFFIARQIFEAFVSAAFKFATAAGHDIAVYVNRVYRVGDSHDIGFCKDFLHISYIALRAVADKDFISGNIAAAGFEIMLCDGFAEEQVALLRTVAAESFYMAHFFDGLFHSVDDSRSQRLGHVADAKGNNICIGMSCFVSILLLTDSRKQVSALKV